ncbi:hypothetical protein AUP68_04620 [Ilyonectria robusta]
MAEKRKNEDEVPGGSLSSREQSRVDESRTVESHLTFSNDDAVRDRRFAELYSKPPDFKELAQLDPDFADLYASLSS